MVENKILDKSKDGSETDIYEKVKKTVNLLINTDIDYLYKKQREHITKDESSQAFGVDILTDCFNEYKDSDVLGIDLPLWIDWNNKEKKTLMIVGRDPQRNANNIKNIKNDEDTRLIIGSPYSLASNGGRVANNNYWSFIEPLTENHRLYITDIYKLFIVNTAEKVKNLRGLPIHDDIFKEELKFVQPDKIITFGQDAADAVKKYIKNKNLSFVKIVNKYINENDELVYEIYEHETNKKITVYFIPHISRNVTNGIKTIANLYKSIGELKNDEELKGAGNNIMKLKNKLLNIKGEAENL